MNNKDYTENKHYTLSNSITFKLHLPFSLCTSGKTKRGHLLRWLILATDQKDDLCWTISLTFCFKIRTIEYNRSVNNVSEKGKT